MTKKQELQNQLLKLKQKKREVMTLARESVKPINKQIHNITQMIYREE